MPLGVVSPSLASSSAQRCCDISAIPSCASHTPDAAAPTPSAVLSHAGYEILLVLIKPCLTIEHPPHNSTVGRCSHAENIASVPNSGIDKYLAFCGEKEKSLRTSGNRLALDKKNEEPWVVTEG